MQHLNILNEFLAYVCVITRTAANGHAKVRIPANILTVNFSPRWSTYTKRN